MTTVCTFREGPSELPPARITIELVGPTLTRVLIDGEQVGFILNLSLTCQGYPQLSVVMLDHHRARLQGERLKAIMPWAEVRYQGPQQGVADQLP